MTTVPDALERVPRRAWLVWGVGIAAYVVAVFNRTSLAVAGVDATQRFDAGPTVLSGFVVVQLVVYAAMQVPVGVLLDRFGSRSILVVGALVMASGQLVMALATSLPGAYLARVLVGLGDSMTFICVLRLVPAWFPPRTVPVLMQVTGISGQLGQVLSAIPLAALLAGPGWSTAYAGAAATGVVLAAVVAAVVRDAPVGREVLRSSRSWGQVRSELGAAWREPGTRLGFWSHFTVQYSGMAFALLWGYPFMVSAVGLSTQQAGTVLTLLVVGSIVCGPVLGRLTGRHPLRRSNLVLGLVSTTVLAWTAVLLLPAPPAVWVVVLLVAVLATNGPASMVGFDFARTFNPTSRLGTATGMVNVGGFVATLVTILAVGVVLDLRGHATGTWDDFRLAFAVQYVLWGVGVVGILRARTQTRRRLRAAGTVIRPLPQVVRERSRERTRARRERRTAP